MKSIFVLITFYLFLFNLSSFAQDELDIVNPYQIKVSRTKEADTFYFTQKSKTTNNIDAKKKLDTLRSYDVFLEERQTPFGTAYICNGNEVTKRKYLEFKQFWNAAGACKPCLLYTFDDKDQLKYVAYQFQDCLCGSYEEYYKEGQLKVKGQFKKVAVDSATDIKYIRNQCNMRDGSWTYYFENGETEKVETYVDGKLKDMTMATNKSNTVSTKKSTTTDNEVSEGEEQTTSKKGLIKRIKDKYKSKEE